MDFKQAEERFEALKSKFAEGTLSEADFKAQLEELMIQDEKGGWWMIGYETGQWYRNDGEDWVRAEPPGHIPRSRKCYSHVLHLESYGPEPGIQPELLLFPEFIKTFDDLSFRMD